LPHFDKEIKDSKLTNGVYYGWGYLPSEREILGCVVNIGKSPTFVDEVKDISILNNSESDSPEVITKSFVLYPGK
jgi:FAD synthase